MGSPSFLILSLALRQMEMQNDAPIPPALSFLQPSQSRQKSPFISKATPKFINDSAARWNHMAGKQTPVNHSNEICQRGHVVEALGLGRFAVKASVEETLGVFCISTLHDRLEGGCHVDSASNPASDVEAVSILAEVFGLEAAPQRGTAEMGLVIVNSL
jgi:hypothetical protein